MKKQEQNILIKTQKLYKALTSGKGLIHILDEASRLFENPIMAYDTSLRNIATARYGVQDDPLMNTILQDGYIPLSNVEMAQRNCVLRQVLQGEKKSQIYKVEFLKNRFISSKFEIAGKVSGFIDVIEWCTPFHEEEDMALHAVLREIVEYELGRDQNLRYAKGDALEYFLLHLLQTDELNPDIIAQRAKLLRLHVHKKWLVVVARYTGDAEQYIPISYIQNSLELVCAGGIGTVCQDSVVYLVPADKDKQQLLPKLKDISQLLQERRIFLGISDCFADLCGTKEGYLEANKAIELGRRLSKDNEALIYNYEKYRFYHGLDIIAHHYCLEKFCDKRLLGLMQYDAMYRTSYTSTLRCYLDMGRNAPAAAEKLNIHRNTLDYRLKKIEELQNIQLQNTEDMFSMVYSLYILTYLGTAF